MNLRSGALMAAFVLCAATMPSGAQSPSPKLPDSVTADPAHYTVVFENDIVRLLRVRLGQERVPRRMRMWRTARSS